MKKRLLAILLAAVMIFSLTACETTTDPGGSTQAPIETDDSGNPVDPSGSPEGACDKCGLAECGLEDSGWTCCVWPGDGDDLCTVCKGFFWDQGCQRLYAMQKFNEGQERGEKELINIYTFTDETLDMINFFVEKNPTFLDEYFIQIEYNTTSDAHRTQVSNNINKDGADGVDLFVADVDYAMEFADLPGTATITELGIEIVESEYYAYTLDLMRKGSDLMGLSHQATPGAMYYRADIAQEILGIESEAEMQALVSDWDGFIEVAEQITSGVQDTFMIAGADELKRNFANARTEGWVVDGEFNIDYDTIEEFVDVTTQIMDMDGLKVNAGGQQWSPSWNDGMSGGVFAYFGSTWYLHYVLKDNAGDSHGQWGMIPGPQPFFWGGTYWFGSKVAAADESKADAVRQLIEFFCVNDESITAYMTATGDFPSKKSVVGNLEATEDQKSFFLFETDHYPVFAEIADKIDITDNITKYDDVMNSLFDDFINNVFADGMSIDDALDAMSEGVRANAPSVTVR